MRLCKCAGWIVLSLNIAVAQNAGIRPAFEAASVKTVAGGGGGLGSLRGGPGTNAPGQLTGVVTMKLLLMRAYDLKDYQIAGPGWIDSSRYQIQAKLPAGAAKAQVALMLQSLLTERFGLAAHRETRQLAAYELMVAKSGPKLTPSKSPDQVSKDGAEVLASPKFVKGEEGLPELAPGVDLPRTYAIVLGGPDGLLYKVWGRHETMPQLADRLTAQLDRPVVDATRLQGEYNFTLTWAVESAGGVIPRTGPPPDQIETGNSPVLSPAILPIFAALEKQLGLRLQQKKRPVPVLVIDRLNAKPTEN
jgi:uncharacterized protein (TIGR03435 family)